MLYINILFKYFMKIGLCFAEVINNGYKRNDGSSRAADVV
ncbi:MAG: hypothetical protein K0R80_1643 [Clostridia bacterium]|jgi:hypothetical protein|nr:hypothetical protein [Clostridia bacterium]